MKMSNIETLGFRFFSSAKTEECLTTVGFNSDQILNLYKTVSDMLPVLVESFFYYRGKPSERPTDERREFYVRLINSICSYFASQSSIVPLVPVIFEVIIIEAKDVPNPLYNVIFHAFSFTNPSIYPFPTPFLKRSELH